jgi:hypothetical protein
MENVVRFFDHLVYYTTVWYDLWPLGTVFSHLVYFPRLGMFGPIKIWQPRLHSKSRPGGVVYIHSGIVTACHRGDSSYGS